MPYSVVIAGSTHNTRICAQALFLDDRFSVKGVLTPIPKPIGRKQVLTKNPLHQWAEENYLPIVLVEKKLDRSFQERLYSAIYSPGLLLVVDFGYIVPAWLLQWPTIAPVNIHPSDLPKYRGSSPGQFALLFGEKESAVTLMVMDEKLDHGPIITKLPFAVEKNWTAKDYYAHAFDLVTKKLPDLLVSFAKNPTDIQPQPDQSPTPIAHMLKREDGYVPYTALQEILNPSKSDVIPPSISLLQSHGLSVTTQNVYNLWKGLTPWPGIWTLIPTPRGERRMKLLELALYNTQLVIKTVQLEGKKPQSWVPNLIETLQ